MTLLTKYWDYNHDDGLYSGIGTDGYPPDGSKLMLAADVEAVLGECEEVLEVLMNLIPDIEKLSKVQALLDRLKGMPR